jgi:two-component system nitrate/nitrite response regulator NarL
VSSDEQPRVTVLLVDDHPLLRHGLAALLALEPWVERVVQAATVQDGARTGVLEAVDVAVVDLGLPDGDGVELVRRLRRAPGCPVLVLTMTRDSTAAVRECLDAGATGYVLKDTAPDTVVRAVRTVLDGGLVLGPNVTLRTTRPTQPARLPAPLDRLTATELRLLTLVAQGRTNAEIAQEVGVAEKTVRNRISTMLGLLGVAGRVQAAMLARDLGLTPDGEH